MMSCCVHVCKRAHQHQPTVTRRRRSVYLRSRLFRRGRGHRSSAARRSRKRYEIYAGCTYIAKTRPRRACRDLNDGDADLGCHIGRPHEEMRVPANEPHDGRRRAVHRSDVPTGDLRRALRAVRVRTDQYAIAVLDDRNARNITPGRAAPWYLGMRELVPRNMRARESPASSV